MKLTFVIPTQSKSKIVPIYLRLRDSISTDIKVSTGLLIAKKNWDNKKGGKIRLRSDFKEKDLYRLKLEGLLNFTASAVSLRKDEQISKEWLKRVVEAYNAGKASMKEEVTLFQFIEDFINRSSTRDIGSKQRSEYETTFDYIKKFADSKKYEPDFKDINITFYHEFVEFLQGKDLAKNTIGRKIQTLKAFMNDALDKGITECRGHKVKGFTAPVEDPETVALTREELDKLQEIDLSKNPRLDRVRDLFLVACWTGCRFGDLEKVKPEDIRDNRLHVKQSKTGERVTIPLHPVVQSIMNKYEGKFPPSISNQRFNEYVRELCKEAKINDPVHRSQTRGGVTKSVKYKKWQLVGSHTGRRTFCTIQYRAGFPAIGLMKISGHKTESSFLRYIRVSRDENAKMLEEFWQKNGDHLKIAK
jgi:integrase